MTKDFSSADFAASEGLLAAMPNLLGTTLRGDGRVLLVLDPEALLA